MTGTNPTPRIRYSYAKGSIPDFSIDFSKEVIIENGGTDEESTNTKFNIGPQNYIITEEEFSEYRQDPNKINLLFGHIYADKDHVLTFSQEEGLVILFTKGSDGILETSAFGLVGNISYSSGTIAISFTYGEPSTVSFELSNDDWCYYADENGEYGLYFYNQFGSGLYTNDKPLCPMTMYLSELTQTTAFIYDGSKWVLEGTLPGQLELMATIEDDLLTDIHWTAENMTYPVRTYILPISTVPADQTLVIPVTYDSTSRRISLPKGTDPYGGATTDVNSVKLTFTGIEPFGDNFIARVDFAAPIKKDDYTIEHPFILLDPTNWSAVIPNAVLMAAKDTKKLPFQLVLANDSQVINSRNAIILEVTPGIDSLIPGSDLPEYEAPEWPLPEEITYTEEDVYTVEATYDPATRTLTTPSRDMYGGATIDTRSVRINVSGIIPTGNDFSARLDFAAPIRVNEEFVVKPFVVLEQINNTWCAIIPQAVLMAAKETKKLPFQLVTRHGDTVINSRNTIVLEITRAINAMESVNQAYTPYVMYRNDTWEWIEDFTYDTGAVVVYNGEMYTSLSDNNLGFQPDENPEKWSLLTGVESIVLGGEVGTRVGSSITFTSAQVFTAAGFASEPRTISENERIPVKEWPEVP